MPFTIPARLNQNVGFALALLNTVALFLLPWLLRMSPLWAMVVVGVAVTASTQWGLIHEAIHKILHPDEKTNERWGRLLAALFGASFHVLRFGHLMHHKLNRQWHSEAQGEDTLGKQLGYYWHLLFGLYASEVGISFVVALLPRRAFLWFARHTFLKGYPDVEVAADRFLYKRGHIHEIRTDMAAAFLMYATAIAAFGTHWPVLLLLVGLRGMMISFMDNIYHYATPADNSKAGKELVLNPALSAFLFHSNYHETHHLNPLVPWKHLPDVHAEQARRFDGSFLAHGMMQFAGV